MGLIDDELFEVSLLCENVIAQSKLVTCLINLVRVDIHQSISRQITVCIRFPENYPTGKLLLEFKSKTLSPLFVERFNNMCDTKLADFVGKPQVIKILQFISHYLSENPLCIVLNEIQYIRQMLSISGELKLKQKTSSISLVARGGEYFYSAKFTIPSNYPMEQIQWDNFECNLPNALVLFVNGQAKEIARQCVEAPLRQQKGIQTFEARPSLQGTLEFIIAAMRDFPLEKCPVCKACSLPSNPSKIVTTNDNDEFVVRMFCGHIYHQGCLKRFMSEPPFLAGGKTCTASKKHPRSDRRAKDFRFHGEITSRFLDTICGQRVTHDKWGLNDVKSAEAKWAHQQAKIRELEEVIDFMH